MAIQLPHGKLLFSACLLLAGWAAVPCASRAQDDLALARTGLFDHDRDVTVRERPRPEFTGAPIPIDGFLLTPTLTGSLEYNDNILATDQDTESDAIFRLQPSVTVTSDWNRNLISAFARASANEYVSHSSESTTDWASGVNGRLDIEHDWGLQAASTFEQHTEPRTSPLSFQDIRSPSRFTVSDTDVETTREFGRFRATVLGDLRDFTYDNDYTRQGVLVYEQDRDRAVAAGTFEGEYALLPGTSVIGEVTLNKRDFDHRLSVEPSRSSGGYEASVGANFDFTRLLRGVVAVGYQEQDYRDHAYKNASGPSLRANLSYFPTQLITVSLTASRTVEDADIIGASNFINSDVVAQADYELLRNLIITGSFEYGADSYDGYDRSDQRYIESLSAVYLLNRKIGLSLKYSNYREDSEGANFGPRFDVNSLVASVVYQYGG